MKNCTGRFSAFPRQRESLLVRPAPRHPWMLAFADMTPVRTVIVCAAIMGLAVVLRLYQLGAQSFWIDEVWSVRVASQSLTEIVSNYRPSADIVLRDQAPLSFMIAHFFVSADPSEWSARLPSALFGSLGVAALFVAAVEILPSSSAALAALLLALSPLHVWYSQEVRWYAQWSLLVTLSYAALLRAWRSGRGRAWAGYVILTLLAVYTFLFTFFVVACQAVSLWCLPSQEDRWRCVRRFARAVSIICVAALPVLWTACNQLGFSSGTPRPTTTAALAYTVYAYAVGFSLGPPLAYLHTAPSVTQIVADYPVVSIVYGVCIPLLLVGLRRLRAYPQAAAVLIPWLFGLPLAVFIVGLSTHVTYQVRYTLAALPVFMLVLALGIEGVRLLLPRALLIGAVVGCSAGSLGNYYWNPGYGKEDVRTAVSYVRTAEGPVAPIIAIGQIGGAVEYYGRDRRVVRLLTCSAGPTGFDRLAAAPVLDAPALWVIIGRDWEGEARRCLSRLSSDYDPTERRRFAGVDVLLLRRSKELCPEGIHRLPVSEVDAQN